MMAQISDYLIVTYERKPGYWRAAVSRKNRPRSVVDAAKVLSIVTPDDFASEAEAQFAAEKIIRRL
jgi:hypothetical protein